MRRGGVEALGGLVGWVVVIVDNALLRVAIDWFILVRRAEWEFCRLA